MHGKIAIKTLGLLLVIGSLVFSGNVFGQDTFEKMLAKKVDSLLAPDKNEAMKNQLFPDDALTAITIPSGFGGYGSYIFGSVGGAYQQVYHTNADLIASGGFCVGNPVKAVNFAAGINMTDVHKFQDFSANFILSKVIFRGSSISVGALQLFAVKKESDAPGQTYYVAFSHAVQSLPSETPGSSRLTYTIGIGNGRFYNKSPFDIEAGKGLHGTAVFGGISYEVVQHINLNAEWSGMNLGLTFGIRPFDNALSFGFGITNLTRFSADKPNLSFTFGLPLSLSRSNN